MLTRAEAKRHRREIDRQIAADLKAKARAKLTELKGAIGEARRGKRDLVRRAREACTRSRAILVRRARERRKRLLAELASVTRQEREAAKGRCAAGKTSARSEARSSVERAARAYREERDFQRQIRRIEANNRRQKIGIVRTTRHERRTEGDDAVRANLEPELVPLWEKVRGKIKGSAHRSRTEAFLEYAEAHPSEIVLAQEDRTDEVIRDLERKMRQVEPFARGRRRRYTPF